MKYSLIYIFLICAVLSGMAQTNISVNNNKEKTRTYMQCVDSADYYIRREMWPEAERLTIEALRLKPALKTNYVLWSNLGDIRTALGNYDEALQAFDIALTTSPVKEQPRILNNRAFAFLSAEKEDEALNDINKSLMLDSVQEWPLKMRGIISLRKGLYDKSEADFKSLKSHYPDNPASYTGLGKIESTKGNHATALSYFRKSLELEQNEETWFYIILLNIEADKLPEAREDLYTALKRYPRCGNLYLLRGLLHKKNFENDQALMDKKIAKEYGADPHLIERFLPSASK